MWIPFHEVGLKSSQTSVRNIFIEKYVKKRAIRLNSKTLDGFPGHFCLSGPDSEMNCVI